MTIFELAKHYYPRLWSAERIKALAAAGKLTQQQADEIIETKE